ncbi:hypothetical protein [Kitasatospora sp. GAS1066B]
MIADKTSPLNTFLADELPGIATLRASYRSRTRRPHIPTQRPAPPTGQAAPDWGTLGSAVDHRLRFALRALNARDRSVAAGIELAGQWRTVLHRLGHDLLAEIDHLITTHRLDDRTRPLLCTPEVEDRLARACYTAALYEEVYRSGQLWPTTTLGRAEEGLTLEDLLHQVPNYAVTDLTAMTGAAETGLATVRAATTPEQVVLAPLFAGSADVEGADADWIADRTLIDVKATATPDALPGREVQQLVGYLLLDYEDTYRIERLG